MPILVGRKAPDFSASAVKANGEIVNNFRLSEEIRGKYGLVFFYPLDFTFVCPSELIALNNRVKDFNERQVAVIGVSIDSHFTHAAWRNTAVKEGGIGELQFPLVADINHSICQSYGVEHPELSVAYRAAFLIDKTGLVRCEHVNDLPIGRNVDELLRLFDALQFHEKHGEVCPAGWAKGQEGMKATKKGVAEYLSCHEKDL